jgi:hypothetical protein
MVIPDVLNRVSSEFLLIILDVGLERLEKLVFCLTVDALHAPDRLLSTGSGTLPVEMFPVKLDLKSIHQISFERSIVPPIPPNIQILPPHTHAV